MNSVRNARQRMLRYPETLAKCAPQAAAYGQCVSRKENVKKSDCMKEFEALKECVKTAMFYSPVALTRASRIQAKWWFSLCINQQWPTSLSTPHMGGIVYKQSSVRLSLPRRIMKDGENTMQEKLSTKLSFLEKNLEIIWLCWMRIKQLLLFKTCQMVVDDIHNFLSSSPRPLPMTDYPCFYRVTHPASHNFLLSCQFRIKVAFQNCRFTHSSASLRQDHRQPNFPLIEKHSAGGELSTSRLQTLAKILRCSIEEMKALATRHPFFSHLSPELIQEKLFIMLSFGLTHEFVREHARLLYQTSSSELDRRLRSLQELSFLNDISFHQHKFLPHYLECDILYFDYALQNLIAQRDALEGCIDQEAYLQFRLKCSEAVAKKMLQTYPLNRQVTNVRLKGLLDFFLNEAGFSPEFVIRHRRLMAFSTRRLRSRLETIRAIGIKSERSVVYIWNLSEKEFKNKYDFELNIEK